MNITFSIFIRVIFVIDCIKFFSLRTEETYHFRPKRSLDHTETFKLGTIKRPISLLSLHLPQFLLALQSLTLILLIGGIEKNPGPFMNVTCSYCEQIRPTSDLVECTSCFRCYHPQCISTLSTCSSSIKDLLSVRGRFMYVCAFCCDKNDKTDLTHDIYSPAPTNIDFTTVRLNKPTPNDVSKHLISKMASRETLRNRVKVLTGPNKQPNDSMIPANNPYAPEREIPALSTKVNYNIRIIIHKRRKLAKHTPSPIINKQPNNLSSITDPLTCGKATERHSSGILHTISPPQLMSLMLKPPPIFILRKWWGILDIGYRYKRATEDHHYKVSNRTTASEAEISKCRNLKEANERVDARRKPNASSNRPGNKS